jgi:uncharacterized protein
MSLPLSMMVGLTSCTALVHRVGGASKLTPQEFPYSLSADAQRMAETAYGDVDPMRLADYHVHLVGLGEQNSGCYVNPRMRSWRNPRHHIKFLVYCSAAGVRNPACCESQYNARLRALIDTAPGRFLLLAFDEHRDASGAVVPSRTEFHIPNDHALAVARASGERVLAAGSVHPLRPDALSELRRLHRSGVRVIKWLPNAMGIHPNDPRCLPFYREMHRLGLVLLTHGGHEAAVDAAEDQCLGNPQLLEPALASGVKIIIAHCASLGAGVDHGPGGADVSVPNWQLLFRMMDDPRWDGLLFADLSATTQVNRSPEFLRTVIERSDLHRRLVNGSDYPLPAVNIVISLNHWVKAGLLDPTDVAPLREIYDVNPLAFDYVLKRRLRVLSPDGRVHRFSSRLFMEHHDLPLGGG